MKREPVLVFVLVVMSLFSASGSAQEILLATYDSWEGAGGGQRDILTELHFGFGYEPEPTLYEELLYWTTSPADAGSTLYDFSETGLGFDFAASLLTNGTEDGIMFNLHYAWESNTDYLLSGGGKDFQGYTITNISLVVHSLILDSPGSNPNGDGNWTDYNFDVTYEIWGIPEPSGLLLLGLGMVMLRRKGQRVSLEN